MRISIIAALTKDKVIGNNNVMPWHIPEELAHFKKMTLGKPVIMGRNTFASLNYKPLPKRKNIVLTRNKNFNASNVSRIPNDINTNTNTNTNTNINANVNVHDHASSAVTAFNNNSNTNIYDNLDVAHNISDALSKCKHSEEVMIIGGSAVYKEFLPITNRLYLSFIHQDYEGDAFFPDYQDYEWIEVLKEEREKFTVVTLDKL